MALFTIQQMMKLLPIKLQILKFSAIFSDEIKTLANNLLNNMMTQLNTASEQITQFVHMVDKKRKREILSEMISRNNLQRAIVASHTKHGDNNLAGQLNKDGITCRCHP